MAVADKGLSGASAGSSILNDERYRSVFYQIVVFGLIAWTGYYLIANTANNLQSRGMSVGLDFLSGEAGFSIAWSLLEFKPNDSYFWVYLIGITNTLIVSFIAIILTTILGFFVGIMRLSSNWLVSNLAGWYVEILRNTPLLLQIIFWYLGVFSLLPRPKQSLDFGGAELFFLNNRGFYMPKAVPGELFWITVIAILVAIAGAIYLTHRSNRIQEATGEYHSAFWPSLALLIGLPLAVFFASGSPLGFEIPAMKGFNFRGGGRIPPAMCALLIALVIYHSSYAGEMVRAGIMSVSHGQTEASYSLGLKPSWTMRLVIIPQAMRAIIPPMISLWMNVVKNSSLAIAIGYPDIVSVFMQTSLNQSGHAIEIVAMVMLFYMTVSLSISAALNVYNKHVQLKER